jgi:hypothetical protein
LSLRRSTPGLVPHPSEDATSFAGINIHASTSCRYFLRTRKRFETSVKRTPLPHPAARGVLLALVRKAAVQTCTAWRIKSPRQLPTNFSFKFRYPKKVPRRQPQRSAKQKHGSSQLLNCDRNRHKFTGFRSLWRSGGPPNIWRGDARRSRRERKHEKNG